MNDTIAPTFLGAPATRQHGKVTCQCCGTTYDAPDEVANTEYLSVATFAGMTIASCCFDRIESEMSARITAIVTDLQCLLPPAGVFMTDADWLRAAIMYAVDHPAGRTKGIEWLALWNEGEISAVGELEDHLEVPRGTMPA
jgi:hypothetical protein